MHWLDSYYPRRDTSDMHNPQNRIPPLSLTRAFAHNGCGFMRMRVSALSGYRIAWWRALRRILALQRQPVVSERGSTVTRDQ
jgi:hypothetical protein